MADISSIGASSSAYATNRMSRIDKLFAKNDRDGDGKLSLQEFSAIRQNAPSGSATTSSSSVPRAADLFKQIDADGDGSITKDEMKTYRDQQVAQMRSAMLNLQEVFGSVGARGGAHGSHGHGHHHGMDQAATQPVATGDATTTQSAGQSDVVDALMKMLDTSNDGNISKDELSAFLQKAASPA